MIWSHEILKNIEGKAVTMPLCIPSYNRPHSTTLKLAVESNVPTYLFIYPEQVEAYKEEMTKTGDWSNVTIVECIGFKGIIPKRNFISQHMYSLGFEQIFVFDDDVKEITYVSRPEVLPEDVKGVGNYVVKPGLDTILAMWQYILDELYDEELPWGTSGIAYNGYNGVMEVDTDKAYKLTGMSIVTVALNLKYLHDQKYTFEHGWDDVNFTFEAMEKGLNLCRIPWITYCLDMKIANESVVRDPEKEFENTYNYTLKSLEHFGEHYIRTYTIRDEMHIRVRWSRIKKSMQEHGRLVRYPSIAPNIDVIVWGNVDSANEYAELENTNVLLVGPKTMDTKEIHTSINPKVFRYFNREKQIMRPNGQPFWLINSLNCKNAEFINEEEYVAWKKSTI